MRLTERKLGRDNPISTQLGRHQVGLSDGRMRFPRALREKAYRHLIQIIRQTSAQLEIGLCLEESSMFDSLGLGASFGRCNCVL